jgi:hypothetical protein
MSTLTDIAFTIRDDGGALQFVLDRPRRKMSGATIDLPSSAREVRGSDLGRRLLMFRDEVDALETSDSAARAAINVLYATGIGLAGELFGGHQALGLVTELCRAAVQGLDIHADPPLISIDAPVGFFPPIELLPLLADGHPKHARSLQEAVAGFVAFGAVVRRSVPAEIDGDLVLRNADGLPIALFWDANLEGARAEAQFFADLEPVVRTRLRWPAGDVAADGAADELTGHLVRPAVQGKVLDQIHHFACHCDSLPDNPADWELRFRADGSDPADVYLSDLNVAMFDRRADRAPATGLPIVYMNACGSASIRPDSSASFASLFLRDNKNRGFIGTETDVPDDFAARFSEVFYRRLLCGDRLGRALHRAKWTMLEECGNPLGALYTLYADPEIKVEREQPEVLER